MATYVPAGRGLAFVTYIGLPSVASADIFQVNPTIAAGDFLVSKDGGATANLTTLPTVTPAGGKMVKISLSATEMTADNVTVVCSDAAGGEWRDVIFNIPTAARQIEDLAFPTVSGRSIDVDVSGGVEMGTAAVGSIGVAAMTAGALNEQADAILDRNMATGTDSGSAVVRTLRQAVRILRNKVTLSAGTLTVKKEDDTTNSWTGTTTTTAGDPLSEIDPA